MPCTVSTGVGSGSRSCCDRFATKVQGQTALVQGTDYDQLGRATEYTLGTGSNEAIWVDQAYEDGTNRLTRQLVTARTTGSSVSDHHYAYDDSGNLLEDADPVTGDYQCYTYDAHVRLTTVWTPADHPAAGQSPSISDECDSAPTATQAAAGGASLLGGPAAYWQGWSFDTDTGLRSKQTTVSPSLTSAGAAAARTVSDSYTYPAQGQPHADFATSIKRDTTVAPSDGSATTQGSQTLAYATDPIGDTTARPDPAAHSGTGASDGAGEQSLTWDAEGNLATLTRPAGADDGGNSGDEGGTTRYVYDPDGTLLLTDSPSKTVLYDGETQITYTKNGSKLSAERDYDTFAGQIATRTGNGDFDISFLIPNGQGTASVALDGASLTPTRRWFTPYGEARGEDDASGTGSGTGPGAWPNQRGFLADPTDDDTGLTSVGLRMYDASTGRFLSPDPLLDTGDSAQMLGYQYADNNPVTFTDPTGAIAVNASGDPIPEKYQSKVNHAPEYKAGLNTTATVAEYHQSGGRSRYYHSSWYYPHTTWRHSRNSGSGYPSHTAHAKHASKANPGRGIKLKTAKQHGGWGWLHKVADKVTHKDFWDGVVNWTDRANTVLSVAAIWCSACAALSAVLSLGIGIYRVSNGDNSGWYDIAGAATFGMAKGLSTLNKGVKAARIARAPKGGEEMDAKLAKRLRQRAARDARRFDRTVVRRADNVDKAYGYFGLAQSGYSCGVQHAC